MERKLVNDLNSEKKEPLLEDRIVHGILSGFRIRLSAPTIEGAKKLYEEIEQGLELISGQISIRYVNSTDVERFKLERFRYRQNMVPHLGDILIEGKSRGPFIVKDEFELIFSTILALRLLKSGPVFLKNIYSFPKDSISADDLLFGMPLPIPDGGPLGYTLYLDEKEDLENIIGKLKDIDFKKRIFI